MLQIRETRPFGAGLESPQPPESPKPPTVEDAPKRKRGWPKGKPRKVSAQADEVAPEPKPIAEVLAAHPVKPVIEAHNNAEEAVALFVADIKERNGVELPTNGHAARILAERAAPKGFGPIPEGFREGLVMSDKGIRVLHDMPNGITAIQFAEDRTPTRDEKDKMEIKDIKYGQVTGARTWERSDYENPDVNLMDTNNMARELAAGRQAVRQR